MKRWRWLALTLSATLVIAACGGGKGEDEGVLEAQDLVISEADPTNPCGPKGKGQGGEARPPADGATTVTLTAADYRFGDLADVYAPGSYGFAMRNEGEEFHEFYLFRLKAGETRPVDELLELGDEERTQVVEEYLGITAACPGQASNAMGVTLIPGRYILFCTVVTGMRPDVPDADTAKLAKNPPHYTKGMFAHFTSF